MSSCSDKEATDSYKELIYSCIQVDYLTIHIRTLATYIPGNKLFIFGVFHARNWVFHTWSFSGKEMSFSIHGHELFTIYTYKDASLSYKAMDCSCTRKWVIHTRQRLIRKGTWLFIHDKAHMKITPACMNNLHYLFINSQPKNGFVGKGRKCWGKGQKFRIWDFGFPVNYQCLEILSLCMFVQKSLKGRTV